MNCNILRLDENYVLKALLKMEFGVIAQLVERCDGIAEVSGSRPLNSIGLGLYIALLVGTRSVDGHDPGEPGQRH